MFKITKIILIYLTLLSTIAFSQNILWDYAYNGLGNRSDQGWSITRGNDGNLYIAATVWNNNNYDFVVISISPSGQERWVYTYNGPANNWDEASSIVYGVDGNLYAAGSSTNNNLNFDFIVISLTTTGSQRWVYRYDGPGHDGDAAFSLVYGSDGNIYVAGTSTIDRPQYANDLTVISLTPNGNQRWVYYYRGTAPSTPNRSDCANSIVYGEDGHIYVAGYSDNASTGTDFTVISLTTNGQERWIYHPGLSMKDAVTSLVFGRDGNIYAAGYAFGGYIGIKPVYNFLVVSLNTTGEQRWIYQYDGPAQQNDEAKDIVYGVDNNIYVAGGSWTNADMGYAFTVISLTSTGDQRWIYRYDMPGEDYALSIVEGWRNIYYVAGKSTNDAIVISLKHNGNARWISRYDGPTNSTDIAYSLVWAGDVYATGSVTRNSSLGLDVLGIRVQDPIPPFVIVSEPVAMRATGPNQGKHLMRVANTKEMHIVYEDDDGITYCYSPDDNGENWDFETLGYGYFPCIGINYKGQPWVAYCKDGDLICKIKREDGSWKEILIFDGNENLWAGPPSMQLATGIENKSEYAYITYPVYEGTMPDNPGPQPPANNHSLIYISLFDTTGVNKVTHQLDEGDADLPLSHPCVGVTPADLIHIVWQQEDEIWYITNTGEITPENWQDVQWTLKYNISNTKEVSEHPFVEAYGDIVSVVWKENNERELGEIVRKQRKVWEPSEYEKWEGPDNLSNSPELNSDYPQMSTREVIVWQEQDEQGNYKPYANICEEAICLAPEANNISYAHTNVLIEDPMAPEIMVYYCYTDEITEGELYEVKFDKYEFPSEPGEGEEVKYYEGKLGEELASTYCEQRTGYIDYGNYKIDYGNNNLKYKLKYLNPCKKYLFQGILYQCTTATIHQKLEVEDTLASDNTISYAIPETISFFIRKNSYKEDLGSKIKLNKIQGAYSVLAKFKLYEYETITDSGGGSGPQSAGIERLPIPTMLFTPKPNPFTNRTQIRFQIPIKTKVDLKIFNSAGRLVNTLMDNEMNPGYYTMNWNGKDDYGRNQSKGIYFVRLKTNNYDATKKMILVR